MLQHFGSVIIEACPYPTQEMLSIIEEKGQESDQIFRYFSEKSHWSLRDKIYTEQPITWKEESVFTVASVLKVRKYFASLTFSISLEMHMCFLSVSLPDEDSFLELWIHDLRIRVKVGESQTSSKIHHQDTDEHFILFFSVARTLLLCFYS